MKRRDLIKTLSAMAREADEQMHLKEGAKHTKVSFAGRRTTVPRHSEIAEGTAQAIINQMKGN